MRCIKCGRETQGEDVFCPGCLESMAASPVKAGTTVTLPQRDKTVKKAQPRKQIKPEKQIARLKKSVRRLRIAVAVVSVLLAVACVALAVEIMEPNAVPNLGQNYNTTDTTVTTGAPR